MNHLTRYRNCFDSSAKLNMDIKQSMEGHAAQQVQFHQTLLASLATLQETVQMANTIRSSSGPQIVIPQEFNASASSAVPSSSVAELRTLGEQLCVV